MFHLFHVLVTLTLIR